jgi:hypothetical protein
MCVIICLLIAVVTVPQPECDVAKHVLIRQPFGYLSSRITHDRGYGTSSCPYRIELPRGQRINITVIDFTTPTGPAVDPPTTGLANSGIGSNWSPFGGTTYDPIYGQPSARVCYLYALIRDASSSLLYSVRGVRVCGGERRERNIYTSRTNAVEILITTKNNEYSGAEYHFLFQFGGWKSVSYIIE